MIKNKKNFKGIFALIIKRLNFVDKNYKKTDIIEKVKEFGIIFDK